MFHLNIVVAQSKSPGGKSEVEFQHRYDIPFRITDGLPMTMVADAEGRSFLYVAAKEGGFRIFDVSRSPVLTKTIPIKELDSLHVMSLTQSGRRIYLALGNHWGRHESVGLAIVDVQNPKAARVLGIWKDKETGGAAGAIVVDGQTAFLAAMEKGLVSLDVSRPSNIRELSRLQPRLDFPDAKPDKTKINARGLALVGDLLFLCYDAGGVRVIDVSDPEKLTEIGRYSNPAMNGLPRAYNNIVVDGKYAYVTADYVGMEVLDVSNPRSIKLAAWWNPWTPQPSALHWFSSPGHANEIAFDSKRRLLLMSAGRSDLVAISVATPGKPLQVGTIGDVEDSHATWGLALQNDRIYLSYIRTLGIPFRADWAGVKAFDFQE
ncbi:MAG: hypothetical protein JNM43_07035 [Planctomycetaceae bacterium]|nr:hypothetical protein [Planctomycetaceae bacterium]